jgi:hypothetical protein
VILCTGFNDRLTPELLERHGIPEVLMKPMIAGDLSRAVRSALTDHIQGDDSWLKF